MHPADGLTVDENRPLGIAPYMMLLARFLVIVVSFVDSTGY